MRIHSFEPIVGEQVKILILGSMPSVKSLEQNMYYGHPRNHFWPIMGKLLDVDMTCDYSARLDYLKAGGIALWDSLSSCLREGSLDQAIVEGQANNIPKLLEEHPEIKLIVFNGRKAMDVFKKNFKALEIRTILMPSTSPIPTKNCRNLEEKWGYWSILKEEL